MARKLSCFTMVLALAAAAASVMVAFPALARTECPAFPKVSFWGEMTHDSVRKHVEDKLGGNWGAYVKKLKRQQKTLARFQTRKKTIAIKRKGRKIKLAGKQLAKYVEFSRQRLGVITCLAAKEGTGGLNEFATAAGTPKQSDASKTAAPGNKNMQRTPITLPKELLTKLRNLAKRQSQKEDRKISVSEVVVKILEKGLKKNNR